MDFLNIKTSWSNLEFIPLKVCIAAAYLIIGSYFHDFFKDFYWPMSLLFLVTVMWSMYLWTNKMQDSNKSAE